MKYVYFEKIRTLLKYYKKLTISSLFSIVLSLGIRILQVHNYISVDVWYISLIPIFAYVLLILPIISMEYYLSIVSFKGLVFNKIVAKWHILNKDGDISSDFSYSILNKSGVPIRELFVDREGFHKKVQYTPSFFITNNKTIRMNTINESKTGIPYNSDSRSVYIYQTTLEISPPIAPGEALEMLREYDVKESELNAFKPDGTFAGLRIFNPTKEIIMYLFAPPHFRIELLSYFIMNEAGDVIDKEKKRQLCPTLSQEKDLFSWRIIYPRNNYRYSFKYRMVSRNEP